MTINPLPDNSHKFKHRIIVKRDSTNFTKVLTAFPVINNETKELVAFVELRWEKDDYNRETYCLKEGGNTGINYYVVRTVNLHTCFALVRL